MISHDTLILQDNFFSPFEGLLIMNLMEFFLVLELDPLYQVYYFPICHGFKNNETERR